MGYNYQIKQGIYCKIAIKRAPNSFSIFYTVAEIISGSKLHTSYKLYKYVLILLDIV